MPRPDKPDPPRLFGAGPTEKEESRQSEALRFDWDEVQSATYYEMSLNLSQPFVVAVGEYVNGLRPNTAYFARLRAVNTDGSSDWSDLEKIPFLTRPPTPQQVNRLPYDLAVWGVSLRWQESDRFNESNNASVELHRSFIDGNKLLVKKGQFVDTHLDLEDPSQRPKKYFLRIVARTPHLPNRVNNSYFGPALLVKTSYALTVVGEQRPLLPEVEFRKYYGSAYGSGFVSIMLGIGR